MPGALGIQSFGDPKAGDRRLLSIFVSAWKGRRSRGCHSCLSPFLPPWEGRLGGPGTSTSVTVLYHLQARALSYTHKLLQTSNKGPALPALRQA